MYPPVEDVVEGGEKEDGIGTEKPHENIRQPQITPE